MEATSAPTIADPPKSAPADSHIEPYLRHYRSLEESADASSRSPGRLARLRSDALEQVASSGFPSARDEEWRFTPLGPITRGTFEPAAVDLAVERASLRRYFYEGSCNLVCVNGVFRADLSDPLEGGFLLATLGPAGHEAGHDSDDSAREVLVERWGHWQSPSGVLLSRSTPLCRPMHWRWCFREASSRSVRSTSST